MRLTIPLVIHDEFGGFSLTPEIIHRLKGRGCPWVDRCGHDSQKKRYYLPYEEDLDDTLRKDPDLVAVVREITEELDERVSEEESAMPWREQVALRQELLGSLKVVEAHVNLEIEDYDGKERVRVVTGGVW